MKAKKKYKCSRELKLRESSQLVGWSAPIHFSRMNFCYSRSSTPPSLIEFRTRIIPAKDILALKSNLYTQLILDDCVPDFLESVYLYNYCRVFVVNRYNKNRLTNTKPNVMSESQSDLTVKKKKCFVIIKSMYKL